MRDCSVQLWYFSWLRYFKQAESWPATVNAFCLSHNWSVQTQTQMRSVCRFWVVVCCRCIFIFVGRQCFLLFFFLVFSSICIDFLFFLFLFWFGFLGYFGGVFFPSNHCLNPETLLVFCFLEEKQGQCPVTHPHICEDAALQCQSFFQEEFSRDSGQPQPR